MCAPVTVTARGNPRVSVAMCRFGPWFSCPRRGRRWLGARCRRRGLSGSRRPRRWATGHARRGAGPGHAGRRDPLPHTSLRPAVEDVTDGHRGREVGGYLPPGDHTTDHVEDRLQHDPAGFVSGRPPRPVVLPAGAATAARSPTRSRSSTRTGSPDTVPACRWAAHHGPGMTKHWHVDDTDTRAPGGPVGVENHQSYPGLTYFPTATRRPPPQP